MATDAVANQSIPSYWSNGKPSTKSATPEKIALSNPILDPEVMSDLLFENIGGQELINISRNDLVNGQDVAYSPIKISRKYIFNIIQIT